MATYVNDLRLKEIATGDESGTWGTSTNTNLELIAEAFSFGTEAITTNADTHTTTIADGSTDPGRSIYLKYTGTLDSACTITIGPNTVSKLWFIENGTSGSQNIIISQGSGANVTVPAGEVKAIYSDGAGSGAAMVDAFANLKVSDAAQTNITSLGTLTTLTVDDITIDGSTISDAGEFTIDAGGDIVLDTDGADIRLKHAGTEWGRFVDNSNNFLILAPVADKDIMFNGVDGSSEITALTLDMSEAGAATFNGVVTADAGIKVDNITIDGTTASLSGSADLTIDVGGRIDLSADDNGEVRLYDGSSLYAQFKDDDDRLSIQGKIADKDMLFTVIDGSSEVTALRIDAADAGDAYFNNNLIVGSTGKIYSSGDTDSYLQFNQADTLRAVIGDSTRMIINTTETVFNEDSGNFDFRIETDDNASMFIVDAGSNDIRIGDATSYVSANLQVTQNNGTEKHLIGLSSGGDSAIAGSGQSARFGEGVVACNTTSDGNTLSIPITSQANLWRQYQVELMVCSAEYNGSAAQGKGGTATFGLTSLTSLNIGNVVVTGNISGVTVDSSSMNVLVEFSSAFTSGLNDYEGCVMHYKVIGITPEYFQGWAATLD